MKILSAEYSGLSGCFTNVRVKIDFGGLVHEGTLSFENDGRDAEVRDDFVPPLPASVVEDFFHKLWDEDYEGNCEIVEPAIAKGYEEWELKLENDDA